ncbi:hypothetical protein GTO27_12095 [Candidatus Bathyarchaeota archaeon]|nr:hypothetical protein [Candidatus Bathyarchaeota archaeon]
MESHPHFTIEQFNKYISEGKLMGGKCMNCGTIHLPPRPLCDRCFSEEFQWIEIPKKGKLLTYTIIHVAPPQFESKAPYAVGIIELKGGLKIPGMIEDVEQKKLKIGMQLTMEFDTSGAQLQWPQWSRYYFKQL